MGCTQKIAKFRGIKAKCGMSCWRASDRGLADIRRNRMRKTAFGIGKRASLVLALAATVALAGCGGVPFVGGGGQTQQAGGAGAQPQQQAAAELPPPTLEQQILGMWVETGYPIMYVFNADGTVHHVNANTSQILATIPFTITGNLLFQQATAIGVPFDVTTYFSIYGDTLVFHDNPDGSGERAYHHRP